MSAFDRLLEQIDGFIRKYYKNLIVKGLFLFLGVLFATFLITVTLEYFGRFNSWLRASLFFGFVIINTAILVKYIAIPYSKLSSLGRGLNRIQASRIIGKFFPSVSDRLLNTLQLNSETDPNSRDYELIQASVRQRSVSMNNLRFADAIKIEENKKYFAWLLPIIGLVFAVGLYSPELFKQGTERVVFFNDDFTPPPAFSYDLIDDGGSLQEGDTYRFEVQLTPVKGASLPKKVYISSQRGKFLLRPSAKNKFEGEVVQVREDLSLTFVAKDEDGQEIKSEIFKKAVVGKTGIGRMQATISHPKYLGLEPEVVENASDLTVPEGSSITWSVLTKNSDRTEMWLGSKKHNFEKKGFSISQTFKENTKGLVILRNKAIKRMDTTEFNIDVVKDAHPYIEVDEQADSLKEGVRYFNGQVGDDHGLKSLLFKYKITKVDGSEREEEMNVSRVSGTEALFNFAVDFRREDIEVEDVIEYYFVVYDNDGVNGSKQTRSRVYSYKLPTLEEVNDKRNEDLTNEKKDLSSILEKTQEFQKDIERLRKESLNSNKTDWNKQNQVEQLKENHKSILEDLQNLQEEMKNSIDEKDQLAPIDEELLKQQEEIAKLMEELMDDELKDLLDQLEELMKQKNKEALDENLEDLEMSSEDMKKQLDRTMEMLKKTQVNEKIDAIEEELKKLAEEQKTLSDEVRENEGKATEVQKMEQERIENQFEKVKDDIKEMDSLNSELQSPMDLMDLENSEKDVDDKLGESKEGLEKNKSSKASDSQKQAGEKMEEMAEQLNESQESSNQQQQQEDMDMLREILEGLVLLSFTQEDVMNKLRRVSDSDPAFKKYSRQQRRIIDDTKIIEDSLFALAMRQPKIASFIDKELNQIRVNHDLALEDIDERRRALLTAHQQYVMTSYNNLALMLNESLQQMQEQMKSMKPGSGSCDKPGGKGMPKPGSSMSPGDMKKMLKEQLKQMEKAGPNPNGNKPGDKPGSKPGQGQLGMGNQQIAKMAAQQSAIRQRLEQLRNELNKDGKGLGNKLNPLLDELEKQENDLINKRLDDNLINRQKEILTRLLESEKAIMERGLDDKRESKEGKNVDNGNQILFNEYNKEKLKQIELLRSVDPAYRKYYKDRANEYFNRVL